MDITYTPINENTPKDLVPLLAARHLHRPLSQQGCESSPHCPALIALLETGTFKRALRDMNRCSQAAILQRLKPQKVLFKSDAPCRWSR
jgi:hypothetical protein